MRRFSTLVLAVYGALASMGAYANAAVRRPKGWDIGKATPTLRQFGYLNKQRVTTAQQKRASTKARNVAKHRRHACARQRSPAP